MLVRTEVNYFQNRAAADALRDADFTHYQFVATLDRRTCARCGNKDGEVYPLSELNQGENAPPLHPRCRCTIIASFGEKLSGTRISEGRKKIPAETSYKEWRAGIENIPQGTPKWRRQQHFSSSDENAQATNPNYALGRAFQTNCQKCVPTYEMRMRGYDVTARPTFDATADSVAQDWDKIFEGAKFEEGFAGSGKEGVIRQMQKWGDGARAEVYIDWAGENFAHVFVAENRGGEIYFLDPQTGELDVEYYFEKVKDGLTKLLRMDNLEPNEKYIKWCCKEVKGNAKS